MYLKVILGQYCDLRHIFVYHSQRFYVFCEANSSLDKAHIINSLGTKIHSKPNKYVNICE